MDEVGEERFATAMFFLSLSSDVRGLGEKHTVIYLVIFEALTQSILCG